jgi:hypothetical protein
MWDKIMSYVMLSEDDRRNTTILVGVLTARTDMFPLVIKTQRNAA